MRGMDKVKGLLVAVMMMVVMAGCSQVADGGTHGEETEGAVTSQGSETVQGKEESKASEDAGKATADASQPLANPVNGQLKVHYIDVGQADATLLEATSNGETYRMLIDTGDLGANDTSDYLNALGVKDIDIVVGTHPHADHIGQMDKIVQNFNVGEVWMSGDTSTSKIYQDVMSAIKSTGVGYEEPRAGDVYDIGDMEVTVVSPKSVNGDLNDGSIEMRVVFGNVDFMFTGDGETTAEQGILARGHKVNAKIMKLGHHGSKTSTTPAFFKSVSPEVAIYSAGKGNSYGHPSKEVVDRVQGAGVKLYGTDANGTVIVTTDGKTYTVKAEKEGKIVPGDIEETEKADEVKKTESATEKTPTKSVAGCVDINTAPRETLMTIKHIGDVRVDELIAGRPYSSVDGLSNVKGIGQGRLADIKEEGLACVN